MTPRLRLGLGLGLGLAGVAWGSALQAQQAAPAYTADDFAVILKSPQERNDPDLNGFADRSHALPDGATVAAGTRRPDPQPDPKRASNPDDVMQPEVTPVPQRRRPGLAPVAPGGQGAGFP
jgi:hypothetical protein